MSRYAIWNKQDPVYTLVGEKLTAEQWIGRRPIAGLETVKVVCAGGAVNGAIFEIFSDFVDMFKRMGCDFSACETDQDYLDAIEAFEDAMNAKANEPTAEERIAAALEYQNMMSL